MQKRILNQKQREALTEIKTSFLNGLTATQIENYITNNVTDLASAKEVLKKMAKIILMLCKHMNLQ